VVPKPNIESIYERAKRGLTCAASEGCDTFLKLSWEDEERRWTAAVAADSSFRLFFCPLTSAGPASLSWRAD